MTYDFFLKKIPVKNWCFTFENLGFDDSFSANEKVLE